MDFKPKILKVIISIILGIILGYGIFGLVLNIYPSTPYQPEGSGIIANIFPDFYKLWIFYILTAIIIYTIWSLIQKKK